MRCEECQSKVEDYFDNELDEQTTDLVAQHLAACRLCANIYGKLQREQELYLQYECEAQASPAFWDNVMARSTQHNTAHAFQPLYGLRGWLANFSAPRFSPSLTALLVLVAIGLTIGVMRYVHSGERSATPAASVSQNGGAPAPLPLTTAETGVNSANQTQDNGTTGEESKAGLKEPPQIAQSGVGRKDKIALAASVENAGRINRKTQANGRRLTPDELVREAEQKYVAAIAMLSRDVNSRRSRLDPKMAARFEQTLAAVERTINDTRRAVREHPGDPVAAQYMLTAYAKKVDVLREMASF